MDLEEGLIDLLFSAGDPPGVNVNASLGRKLSCIQHRGKSAPERNSARVILGIEDE